MGGGFRFVSASGFRVFCSLLWVFDCCFGWFCAGYICCLWTCWLVSLDFVWVWLLRGVAGLACLAVVSVRGGWSLVLLELLFSGCSWLCFLAVVGCDYCDLRLGICWFCWVCLRVLGSVLLLVGL